MSKTRGTRPKTTETTPRKKFSKKERQAAYEQLANSKVAEWPVSAAGFRAVYSSSLRLLGEKAQIKGANKMNSPVLCDELAKAAKKRKGQQPAGGAKKKAKTKKKRKKSSSDDSSKKSSSKKSSSKKSSSEDSSSEESSSEESSSEESSDTKSSSG